MAPEDAVVLSDCISAGGQVEQRLTQFSVLRHERCRLVVERSNRKVRSSCRSSAGWHRSWPRTIAIRISPSHDRPPSDPAGESWLPRWAHEQPPPDPILIDHQAHWYPRAAFDLLLNRPGFPSARRTSKGVEFALSERFRSVLLDEFLELEVQLRDMDANGVSCMVSDPAVCPGDVTLFQIELAAEMCELLNDEMGRAQRELDGRFIGVASLPWQDPQTAIRVLDRAAKGHDLRGVSLHSNIDAASSGLRGLSQPPRFDHD